MDDLSKRSTADLLADFTQVLNELKRDILRTNNNPTGDYAEWLFCRALSLRQEANCAPGWDATDEHGLPYQIKGRRRRASQSVHRPLGFMRVLDGENTPFDVLAAVIFNPDYTIATAVLAPVEVVREQAAYVAHVNAWRLSASSSLLADPRVELITSSLALAAEDHGRP
ncbi:MAG: hypothetical protein ACYCXZ_03155 [Coriobacteriia bacterium]